MRAPRPSILVLLAFWAVSFGCLPVALARLGVDFAAPETWPAEGWAVVAVAALIADAAMAVPTGVIATALGASYGLGVGGAVATVGMAGSTLTGWALGRGGSALLHAIPADDPVRAAVARWGAAALIALRPVPVLAESAALVAGGEGLPLWRAVAAAVVGSAPTALLYASLGAAASGTDAPRWVPYAAAAGLSAVAIAVGAFIGRTARAVP